MDQESMFHIRDIHEQDIEKIRRLEQKSFPDPWGYAGIRESLEQSYTKLFGAWAGDELLGYVIVYFAADEGELVRIAVDPPRRREGVASGLLMELMKVCRAKGVKRVLLDVRESNKAAIKLYESMGFEADGMRKNFYDKPPEAAVLMSREVGN